MHMLPMRRPPGRPNVRISPLASVTAAQGPMPRNGPPPWAVASVPAGPPLAVAGMASIPGRPRGGTPAALLSAVLPQAGCTRRGTPWSRPPPGSPRAGRRARTCAGCGGCAPRGAGTPRRGRVQRLQPGGVGPAEDEPGAADGREGRLAGDRMMAEHQRGLARAGAQHLAQGRELVVAELAPRSRPDRAGALAVHQVSTKLASVTVTSSRSCACRRPGGVSGPAGTA
jgi:hypothetical protein